MPGATTGRSVAGNPVESTTGTVTGSPGPTWSPRLRLRPPPKVVRGFLGVLAFVLVAEGFTRLEIVDPAYLPYVSTVLARGLQLAGDPVFLVEVAWTLYGWALGLTLAILIAVPAGIALGSSRLTHAATAAVVDVLRPIPAVALLPLVILIWGQGTAMKLVLVTFATVWPILFNTIYGVHDVDPVATDTARSFGLGVWARLRRVVLPSAAPFILTGTRVAASLGLVVIVGAELVAGATNGIGAFILLAGSAGDDVPAVIAGAGIAGLLGLAINEMLAYTDRRVFAWARRAGGDR